MGKLPLSWRVAILSLLIFLVPLGHWLIVAQLEKQLDVKLANEIKEEAKFYSELFNRLAKDSSSFRELFGSKQEGLEIALRKSPISIDGYDDEWFPYSEYKKNIYNFSQNASLTLVQDKHHLFGIYQVDDNSITYQASQNELYQSDRVVLKTGDNLIQFVPSGSGALFGKQVGMNGLQQISAVYASWQETKKGYILEFRMPNLLLGKTLNSEIHDVDKSANNNILQGIYSFTDFLDVLVISDLNKEMLLDANLRKGSFNIIDAKGAHISKIGSFIALDDFYSIDALWLSKEELKILSGNDKKIKLSKFDSREMLNNQYLQRTLNPQQLDSYYSIGFPVTYNNSPLGSFIISKSAIIEKLELRRVFVYLTILIIVVWILSIATMLFSVRANNRRIRKLREQTIEAFTQDGQIIQEIDFEHSTNDELSDLADSFSYLSKNIKQHNDYQKNLIARLNHELRTPIAIIRSSLDNMSLTNLSAEDRGLLASAQSGTSRLSTTLGRLSEANRLEQAISTSDKERFEIKPIINDLVNSYRVNWPNQEFLKQICIEKLEIEGSRELFAQMLDKLVSNAVDFSEEGKPIEICLKLSGNVLLLQVSNYGALIEQADLKKVFNILFSSRKKKSDNLGLGLFVAQKIAMFHASKIKAYNRTHNCGVTIQLSWKSNKFWLT